MSELISNVLDLMRFESGQIQLRSDWQTLDELVESALRRLEEEGVVQLDEERRAAMVSNLLVVLCSEQATQQVVNTGSLYQ